MAITEHAHGTDPGHPRPDRTEGRKPTTPPGPGGDAGHGGHDDHGGHGGHEGHGDHVAMFRRLFLVEPAARGADGGAVDHVRLDPGLLVAGDDVARVGVTPAGHGDLPVGRATLPHRCRVGDPRSAAGDDAAGRAGDHGRLPRLLGGHAGPGSPRLDFWWELALLVVIMLLGHWVEMRSLAQTASALDSLAALLPDEAERVRDGQLETVTPDQLEVGDVVVVRPGGRIPADGRVVDGSAAVDESMITGESRAVRRDVGSTVVAGTVATDSGIRVEVTATVRTPRWPGSASSSPTPRHPDRAPSGWPTPPPVGCSGSPWAPGSSPRSSGPCWDHPTRPSSAPSPCSSSPAPTHWDWRSRWSSPSPPSARHARGCS